MPNHCENTLTVVGAENEVRRFLALVQTKENPLDFEAIVPYPEVYKQQDIAARAFEKEHGYAARVEAGIVDGYNQGGYEWCVRNWGTKWNSYEHVTDNFILITEDTGSTDNSEVSISFFTAWSPPIEVVKRLNQLFPTLEFELHYYELGCNFRGFVKATGDSIEEREWEITNDDLADLGLDEFIEDEDQETDIK